MIKILTSGFYSTIQDYGRIGFQDYGVPYSGVMDKNAYALANLLLGNNPNEAVIEMTMIGATFQFTIDTYIAITGANMHAKLNNIQVENNKVLKVKLNDVLSLGKAKDGFRSYLAVLGGFNTEIVMNSKSMYQDITKQVRLFKKDELLINESSKMINTQNASIRVNLSYMQSAQIEVFKGPEFDSLSKHQQKLLFLKPFTVSSHSNRMGYQLKEVLENELKPIITSAVLPGTVQLTPSGKLIILMRDCQTSGGYPRVLQLKESAINVLSQKFTNQLILFKQQTSIL